MSNSIAKSNNVIWHNATVTRDRRALLNGHRSIVLWFTGFSGAGKSTLAHALEEHLYQAGYRTFVLDGDNVRHGLCGDLDFSEKGREENIRRVSEVANLFLAAGIVVMTAFISPFRSDRTRARNLIGRDFVEIFCDCALDICEQRDTKGLYKRARMGEIPDFTGISSPYETPEAPELIIKTGRYDLDSCVKQILDYLTEREIYPRR